MPVRTSDAQWNGPLKSGNGTMRFGGGAWEGPFTFDTRFVNEEGATNPEELIAAAFAGCYSMALAGDLGAAGHEPTAIRSSASVHLDKSDTGFTITSIDLRTEAEVPGIEEDEFQGIADGTKRNCPVARLLTGAAVSLEAKLI
ncbi:MAG: OsmC family peroxiredoxin [Acidimicrobiales bacterium]